MLGCIHSHPELQVGHSCESLISTICKMGLMLIPILRIACKGVQVNSWHRVRALSVNAELKAKDLLILCTWLTHLRTDVEHVRPGCNFGNKLVR